MGKKILMLAAVCGLAAVAQPSNAADVEFDVCVSGFLELFETASPVSVEATVLNSRTGGDGESRTYMGQIFSNTLVSVTVVAVNNGAGYDSDEGANPWREERNASDVGIGEYDYLDAEYTLEVNKIDGSHTMSTVDPTGLLTGVSGPSLDDGGIVDVMNNDGVFEVYLEGSYTAEGNDDAGTYSAEVSITYSITDPCVVPE